MSNQTDSDSSNVQVRAQYDDDLMPIWKRLNVPIKRASGCTDEQLIPVDGLESAIETELNV